MSARLATTSSDCSSLISEDVISNLSNSSMSLDDVQSVEFDNNLSDLSQSIATRTAILQIPSTQESHDLQKSKAVSRVEFF